MYTSASHQPGANIGAPTAILGRVRPADLLPAIENLNDTVRISGASQRQRLVVSDMIVGDAAVLGEGYNARRLRTRRHRIGAINFQQLGRLADIAGHIRRRR